MTVDRDAAPPAADDARIGRAYDGVADEYDRHLRPARWMRRALWWRFDGLFRPGSHVLDIGCGTGLDTVHLAERGVRVMAVDASEGMVRQLRTKLARGAVQSLVDARTGDAVTVLRSLAGPFDGIVSSFAALNTIDLESFVPEAARLLRPGAPLVAHLLAPGHGLGRRERLRSVVQPLVTVDSVEIDIRGHRLMHHVASSRELHRRFFDVSFARKEKSVLDPLVRLISLGRFYVLDLERRRSDAPGRAAAS
jgi:SAM-dependent methyltransferase